MNICNPLRRVACVLALSACAAAPALAKDSGFYLGATVGQSKYDVSEDVGIGIFPIVTGSSTDDSDTSFSLSTGYRFNPYLGVDLSLHDFGDVALQETGFITTSPSLGGYADAKAGARGTALSAVGTLPLGKFELYAKLGAIYAEAQISSRVTSTFGTLNPAIAGVRSVSSKTTEALYGVGAGYTFAEEVFVKLEYLRVPKVGDEEDLGIDEVDVDVISLGFEYRF